MKTKSLAKHKTITKFRSPTDSKKRLFDIVFSLSILIIFSPLFLLIITAIYLSSPGKVIYAQPRLGKAGKIFRCYKFRTMYLNADEHLQTLLRKNPFLRAEWNRSQKLKNDPRVFPFGRLLRKMSLDELPQFVNVLKGDLSVVGPRPYMTHQRQKLGPSAYIILSMRPGITGIWQTSGRNSKTFQERIELDSKYINQCSFWKDIILILKTIPEIFFSNNAY